jgi:hypothetical protein
MNNKNSIKLSLVVAINNSNLGIGYKGQLPWRIPKGICAHINIYLMRKIKFIMFKFDRIKNSSFLRY